MLCLMPPCHITRMYGTSAVCSQTNLLYHLNTPCTGNLACTGGVRMLERPLDLIQPESNGADIKYQFKAKAMSELKKKIKAI